MAQEQGKGTVGPAAPQECAPGQANAEEVERKLSAARTRLILDKPFLGALVLRLPMIAADAKWCRTTATDARAFYYNPEYITALRLDETQFVLAHEALHCALSHFARREHRVKLRWDIACDFAINPLLVKDGLKPPPGSLLVEGFDGMTAEEIYPYIEENPNEETLDDHLYDAENETGGGSGTGERSEESRGRQSEQGGEGAGGTPKPAPLDAGEKEKLAVQWRQRLAGAAQQAMMAGKLGGAMARMVDHLLQPQLPWRMLLAHYMTATARNDYNYSRPSRREGPAIFPSLRSSQIELLVVIDTSGSVSGDEIKQFLSEVNAIKSQVNARITLHACDVALAADGPWVFEPWQEFELPREFQGGGGTSFVPVFQWLEVQDRRLELVVYFTDAQGEFPSCEPDCPVIWLVKGKGTVPWGQRIQLN